MDASCLGDHYAEADLCQKLKTRDEARFSLGNHTTENPPLALRTTMKTALGTLNESRARHVFDLTGGFQKNSDPYWN